MQLPKGALLVAFLAFLFVRDFYMKSDSQTNSTEVRPRLALARRDCATDLQRAGKQLALCCTSIT